MLCLRSATKLFTFQVLINCAAMTLQDLWSCASISSGLLSSTTPGYQRLQTVREPTRYIWRATVHQVKSATLEEAWHEVLHSLRAPAGLGTWQPPRRDRVYLCSLPSLVYPGIGLQSSGAIIPRPIPLAACPPPSPAPLHLRLLQRPRVDDCRPPVAKLAPAPPPPVTRRRRLAGRWRWRWRCGGGGGGDRDGGVDGCGS